MKLKDLLNGRKKLKEYDELKEWKNIFSDYSKIMRLTTESICDGRTDKGIIPLGIRNIILSALDAEIAKLEEE